MVIFVVAHNRTPLNFLLVKPGEKLDIKFEDVGVIIPTLLETIQQALFDKAKEGRDKKLVQVTKWADFVPALEQGCMVLTPFCDQAEWEDKVKVCIRRVLDAIID